MPARSVPFSSSYSRARILPRPSTFNACHAGYRKYKIQQKYMAHPIVSQMPKAGNSRLDNVFLLPVLTFFLLLLPFLIFVN